MTICRIFLNCGFCVRFLLLFPVTEHGYCSPRGTTKRPGLLSSLSCSPASSQSSTVQFQLRSSRGVFVVHSRISDYHCLLDGWLAVATAFRHEGTHMQAP